MWHPLHTACFAALVRRGDLGDGLPQRRNQDRVAAWLAEAGASYDVTGTRRREELLHVHRESVVNLELADDHEFKENRNRVASHFVRAGVEYESGTWSWINGD